MRLNALPAGSDAQLEVFDLPPTLPIVVQDANQPANGLLQRVGARQPRDIGDQLGGIDAHAAAVPEQAQRRDALQDGLEDRLTALSEQQVRKLRTGPSRKPHLDAQPS